MLMHTAYSSNYGNRNMGRPVLWLEEDGMRDQHHLHRELAGLGFLALFARTVSATLNPREVILGTAQLLYSYFRYDLALFSFPHDAGLLAFAPTVASARVTSLLKEGESIPDLKSWEIRGYTLAGPVVPGQLRLAGTTPIVVELPNNSGRLVLYCRKEGAEKAVPEILTDVAESLTAALRNAREHDRVKELSVRDGLTGLYNRRVLEEILHVEGSKRTPAPMAILIIDVDDFKVINDTFGHPAGDRVLSVMGRLLRDNCRKENIVARYGGEEFAVLMTDAGLTREVAVQVAERLRKVLGAQVFTFAGRSVRLTVSIGAAYDAGGTESPQTLMACADQALYQAKRSGKNRVCSYGSGADERVPAKRARQSREMTGLQNGAN